MVDVTVRGAGAFGLAVAYGCARKGARVRVVDPYGVGAGVVRRAGRRARAACAGKLERQEGLPVRVAGDGGRLLGRGRRGRRAAIRAMPAAGGCNRSLDDRALELRPGPRRHRRRRSGRGGSPGTIVPAAGDWAPASPTGLAGARYAHRPDVTPRRGGRAGRRGARAAAARSCRGAGRGQGGLGHRRRRAGRRFPRISARRSACR